MKNPYRELARNTLAEIDKIDRPDHREQALALVLAQTTIKAQEGFRRRVWKLEMPLLFERAEVEGLDNAYHYMRLEAAKMIGFAILDNTTVSMIERKQDETKVSFTVTVALVPKEDWGA